LPPSANLPDSLVRVPPFVADPVREPPHGHPEIVGRRLAVLVVEVDRVEEVPDDVELKLPRGIVAGAHGPRAAVPLEVIEDRLGPLRAPVEAVEDLEARVRAELAEPALEKLDVVARLIREADAQEGIDRERGVADPVVAVIPVAGAADPFGQAH